MAREPQDGSEREGGLDPDEVGRLLEELRGLPEEEREAALKLRTGGRPRLAEELRSLLSAAPPAEAFFRHLAPSDELALAPGSALRDPGLEPGVRVGRYRVEGRLGSGGVGVVYRARDEALGRAVALKVVPTPGDWGEGREPEGSSARRFLREARAIASLDHPNICTVHEIGTLAGGWSFLAMTLYDGETLRERIRRGPVPWEEAADVATGIAEALLAAHERAIVHRDVKPGNVMLTRRGRVKLLDFGLAKAADAALTLTGLTAGTVAYMSPEQVRGEEVGPASDLWSLGIVLHEMVVGRHPFAAWPGLEVVRAIATVDPPALSELGLGVPPELSRLVGRLLSREPADRPRDAGEVRDVLRALGAGAAGGRTDVASPPGPRPPPAGPGPGGGAAPAPPPRAARGGGEREEAPRASSSRRRRIGPGALALLALGAVAGGLVRQGGSDAPATVADPGVVAVFPFRAAASAPALAYLEEGMVDLLATKLGDQDRLRAVDPRAALHAWGEAGGAEATGEALTAAAARFGAGRMVRGEIVALADQVSLTAHLHLLDEERVAPPVTVAGPVDSLPSLVDRLAARLLTMEAGEGHRLASLTTGSLEALQAYLEGRAAFRRGRYDAATEAFLRATEADSTFALAGLRLAESALLAERPQHGGLARAWRHRDRLGAADRAYLEAVAGPDYPDPTPPDEAFAALEALVAYQPDAPEAWFWLGQRLVLRLTRSGTPDPVAIQRTGEAFERALELDPTFQPARLQLWLTLLSMADTARANALAREYLAVEDEGLSAETLRCYLALRDGTGDSLPTVLARADRLEGAAAYGVSRCLTVLHNWEPGWAGVRDALMDSLGARAGEPGFLARNGHILRNLSLDRGRPRDAARYAGALRDVGLLDRLQHRSDQLRFALWWDGDPSDASEAERELAAWLAEGPSDPLRVLEGREPVQACAVGQWWAAHGRREEARRLVRRLREGAERSAAAPALSGRHCAELLDLWLEVEASGSPARLAGTDTLVVRMTAGLLLRETGLVLSRLFEEQGEPDRAREMLQRSGMNNPRVYLSTFHRERGRLAALAGDRQEALRHWGSYLGMRSTPEPALAPQVERIREAVAKLEGGAEPVAVARALEIEPLASAPGRPLAGPARGEPGRATGPSGVPPDLRR